MNQSTTQASYKIAKGQFVNLVSTTDVRICLEEDLHITTAQVIKQRSGDVLVKQTGFQFIARLNQLKPHQPAFLSDEPLCENNDDGHTSLSRNKGSDYQNQVSYVHRGRPAGDGRVVRSRNNFN